MIPFILSMKKRLQLFNQSVNELINQSINQVICPSFDQSSITQAVKWSVSQKINQTKKRKNQIDDILSS